MCSIWRAFTCFQREAMLNVLNRVMEDLDKDVLNLEGFHLFSFTWEMGYQALKERVRAVKAKK